MSTAKPLKANEVGTTAGMQLVGMGFWVSQDEALVLGLKTTPGLDMHIRPYLSGRDLAGVSRKYMVIDLYPLNESTVMESFPLVYHHLEKTVKPSREQRDQDRVKANWWIFGQPRKELRLRLKELTRYIATPETSRRRFFAFIDADVVPDNTLVVVPCEDAVMLGILSSKIHQTWALGSGSRKGAGGDSVYVKSRCFDTFPFPVATEAQKEYIRAIAEQLDAHRKTQQASFPKLTLTAMYGVLEKSRAGEPLSAKERKIAEQAELQELQCSA